ncbi:MAG: riboflavin kinase [Phenylobacterium sp.]
MSTDLIAFLRPEARFASLQDMTAQIDDDASMARVILSAG